MTARRVIQKAGYGSYANHRCGHGIGVGLHEEPYLRFDNELVLQKGMVFSIEPGIYIPQVGGFRHSDTVILTEKGSMKITDYKNKLEDLIF
ncbi:putative dipeptidase PepE [bioreactor metagenome]|uniref:Putative dipeptidase PepE n=1 Tax=bioreactor metagenome TaxID=1076179 RepID=A0A645IQZ3_9ZZZZ